MVSGTTVETRPTFGITSGLNNFGYDTLNRPKTATRPTIPPESYLDTRRQPGR